MQDHIHTHLNDESRPDAIALVPMIAQAQARRRIRRHEDARAQAEAHPFKGKRLKSHGGTGYVGECTRVIADYSGSLFAEIRLASGVKMIFPVESMVEVEG